MVQEAPFATAEREYLVLRAAEAAWLDARLYGVRSGRDAIAAAAKSMKRRGRAARDALERVFVSPADAATAYDRLVASEPAACVNAVAAVAGRFPDGQAVLVAAEASVGRAFVRARRSALKHLGEAAQENLERQRDLSRPVPMRYARRGVKWLFGGGFTWTAWTWYWTHPSMVHSIEQHAAQFLHLH